MSKRPGSGHWIISIHFASVYFDKKQAGTSKLLVVFGRAKVQFRSFTQFPIAQKNNRKHSTRTLEVFCAKNRLKKHQIFETWDNFESQPFHTGCRPCKGHAKKRSKKHQIFKKWDIFENRTSCKGYSPCKGYSLCKMVTFGQKLKMPKTCEKPLYRNNRAVLCKKSLAKNPQIFEKWDNFENCPSCKGYSPWKGLCKMVTLNQTLKMPKTCEKPFYKIIRAVLCKKPLEKTLNIQEVRKFWKWAILQRL